jgi:Phosphoglycerate dehydrogenase and related dehydrogenases
LTEQLIYLYGKLGLHHTALDMLTDRGYTILRGVDDQTDADFLRRAREAQIVVMDDHYFKEAWFDQLPQLRLIIRRGVGYDKIPIEAATQASRVGCKYAGGQCQFGG